MSQPPEIPEYPLAGEPERDGIGEEDRPIPFWFNAAFAVTIVIGVVYFTYWTWISDWSQAGAWREEAAAASAHAAELRAAAPQRNPYRGQAQAIAEGRDVFNSICATCHKPDASGLIGPSLVDAYWKYGSDDPLLFETVMSGRPGGMPAWGPVLGPEKIWKALAYVETLPRADRPGVGAPDYVPPTP